MNKETDFDKKIGFLKSELKMKGCGKHFVEPFDYTCGVKEINGIPLCPSCSPNSHLKASFDNGVEVMRSSRDTSTSDIPLIDKVFHHPEDWVRVVFEDDIKESIKRLKEELLMMNSIELCEEDKRNNKINKIFGDFK